MTFAQTCRSGMCIAVCALAMAVTPALAQAPKPPSAAHVALAREFVVIKGAAKVFEAVIPGVVEQSKNTLLGQNPALQKDLNQISDQLRVEYAPRVNEVLTQFATIYAGVFTEQELKDLLAFYKSPLGQKVSAQEPEALDNGMRYGQDWAIKLGDEVIARMRVELKKKGHDL